MIVVRESTAADVAALEGLYPAAFPEEDLLPVVRDLLSEPDGVWSLVICVEGAVVGHIAFTRCVVEGSDQGAALLGPLAISPAHQGQGLGTRLVRHGIRLMTDESLALICVLGDPGYYGRLGFRQEERVIPPYPLPEAWVPAWQSVWQGASPGPEGNLQVPPPWRAPSLWS